MFKRSVTIETPKMATAYDSAKEHLGPAFETAKESGVSALHTAMAAMVPVVAAAAPAMAAAKSRGADLLNSDAAHEARDRAVLMLAAAKGEVATKKARRWPLAMAFLALGGAVGAAVTAWLQGMSQKQPPAVPFPKISESGHAGPKLDLSHPLTEKEPQPVTLLPDAAEHNGLVDDYSDPKATF